MKGSIKKILVKVLESIKDIVTRLSYSDWIALNGQIYYRKKNGFVILKGDSAASVTISSATLVGTLPSGYRPDQQLDFAASAMGGDSEILCRVETDGRIRMWASPSTRYWSFCVTFPLGGVLHSSIFKAFSDFMSLHKGGGVDEGYSQEAACAGPKLGALSKTDNNNERLHNTAGVNRMVQGNECKRGSRRLYSHICRLQNKSGGLPLIHGQSHTFRQFCGCRASDRKRWEHTYSKLCLPEGGVYKELIPVTISEGRWAA